MPETTPEVLLDLATPRVIVLSDRGRQFTLRCRRITPDDWTRFFNAVTVTSEQRGRDLINSTDVESPRIALAEAVLVDAEGYKVSGADKLTQLENWQSRVPLAHRRMLGEVLSDARPDLESDVVIAAEGEVITLHSTWTAVEQAIDESTAKLGPVMQRVDGLQHIFESPSEEQYRRYQRAANRVMVVGGSRAGKTVYMGAHAMLAELYDELIVRVDGYRVNGAPLTDREQIAREMDLHHKVMAAQALFLPQSDVAPVTKAEQA